MKSKKREILFLIGIISLAVFQFIFEFLNEFKNKKEIEKLKLKI